MHGTYIGHLFLTCAHIIFKLAQVCKLSRIYVAIQSVRSNRSMVVIRCKTLWPPLAHCVQWDWSGHVTGAAGPVWSFFFNLFESFTEMVAFNTQHQTLQNRYFILFTRDITCWLYLCVYTLRDWFCKYCWFHSWSWLHYDENNDTALCFLCCKAVREKKIKPGNADTAFVSWIFVATH